MIQIAINGNRNEEQVPKSTTSILQSSMSAIREGASSIHFHVRDNFGKETLKGKYVDEQIFELKKNLNKVPIGISTGAWIEPNLTKRLDQINEWKILPDFVSINFEEEGYEEIVKLISSKGIQIEVGLNSTDSALNYVNSNMDGNFLRILIEPEEQNLSAAMKMLTQIEEILKRSKNKLPILLHGTGKTCWSLLNLAIERGYLTRIGFEDTLILPNKEKALSNSELIQEANKILQN